MTSEDRFKFDLEGYLVVKNVLSRSEIDNLNAIADREFGQPYDETNLKRTSKISKWDRAYQNLFDHPNILPYQIALLGPKFRADHDYCIFMQKGAKRGNLHGGDVEYKTGNAGDHWYKYKDGVMRNGLTVFTYNLAPAGKGDGGFACVPGSHKSNFPLDLPKDVRTFDRIPHYVVQPEVEAGDVIIFTEALIHGTMPWQGDHERRALLYKFSPGYSSWSIEYYRAEDYVGLTEQQKRILTPPSVGSRPDVVETKA